MDSCLFKEHRGQHRNSHVLYNMIYESVSIYSIFPIASRVILFLSPQFVDRNTSGQILMLVSSLNTLLENQELSGFEAHAMKDVINIFLFLLFSVLF